MVRRKGEHFKQGETKINIIAYILERGKTVSESDIRTYLEKQYGIKDRGRINKHLHELDQVGCIEFFQPEKRIRGNHWGITKIKTLENILNEYPDFIDVFQYNEHAISIVVSALIDSLVYSANTKQVQEYIEEIPEIKEYISVIRLNIAEKLMLSSAFLKMCIQDEYSLSRNTNELLKLSDSNEGAITFIGDGFKLFVRNPVCIDIAFKACVAFEIMKRKPDSTNFLKPELEYIDRMKNTVPAEQLEQLKVYYRNTNIAPDFLKGKKLVSVDNDKLSRIENEFERRKGRFINYASLEKNEPA